MLFENDIDHCPSCGGRMVCFNAWDLVEQKGYASFCRTCPIILLCDISAGINHHIALPDMTSRATLAHRKAVEK